MKWDEGLWEVEVRGTAVYVCSDDFTHDVKLKVTGDFETLEDRIAYAKLLAEVLDKS